jgi:hypothetical protein
MPRAKNERSTPAPTPLPSFAGFVRIEMDAAEFARFDAAVANREYDFNRRLIAWPRVKLTLTPRDDGTFNACLFPQEPWSGGKGVSAFSDSAYEAIALVTWKLNIWAQAPAEHTGEAATKKRRG